MTLPLDDGTLGFRVLLIGFMILIFLLVRRQWRSASIRRDQVIRLVALATEESYLASSSVADYSSLRGDSESDFAVDHRCVVCLHPTSTRCSQCKSARYCSSKCQILHWRRGHKDECRPPSRYQEEEDKSVANFHDANVEVELHESTDEGLSNVVSRTMPSSEAVDYTRKDDFYETRSVSGKKLRNRIDKVDSARKYTILAQAKPRENDYSNSHRLADSSVLFLSLDNEGNASGTSTTLLPSKANSKPKVSQVSSSSGFKTSVQKVVEHFRPPRGSRLSQPSGSVDEMSFPYEMFVKLYSDRVELQPFGLVNLGNSCYANVVLQCLAFTRPLVSYLVRGLHSKACRKKSWCFVCEFEYLILKARGGESPISPIKILSKLQKIGKHLGPGKEEDAHEFLRMSGVLLIQCNLFSSKRLMRPVRLQKKLR